jgi:HPt (histidine-containing phosphotransfer) domain-containing protein
MNESGFFSNALAELLEMGGPDMRGQFLAQLQTDLTRCQQVFETAQDGGAVLATRTTLQKSAHEVKGLALTIGGTKLAELARQLEHACDRQDAAAMKTLLTPLADLTRDTAKALAELASNP